MTSSGEPRRSDTLAVAALVLGILAVLLAPMIVGGGLGLLALSFGARHLRTATSSRGIAVAGVVLGLLGTLGGVGAFFAWRHVYGSYGAFRFIDGSGRAAHPRWVGAIAPPLRFTTLQGEAVELEQFRGRPVVLSFWATWCGPCRQELPHLNRLAREMPDVVVLALSEESADTVRAFADEHPFDARVASVPSPPAPFDDVRSIPTNVFIDRDGIIREVRVGALSYAVLREKAFAAQAGTARP